jgi:hypothetical protein
VQDNLKKDNRELDSIGFEGVRRPLMMPHVLEAELYLPVKCANSVSLHTLQVLTNCWCGIGLLYRDR